MAAGATRALKLIERETKFTPVVPPLIACQSTPVEVQEFNFFTTTMYEYYYYYTENCAVTSNGSTIRFLYGTVSINSL